MKTMLGANQTAAIAVVVFFVLASMRAQAQDESTYMAIPFNASWSATAHSWWNSRTPMKAVNAEPGAGPGLDANGLHDTNADNMWLSDEYRGQASPAGIWYRFNFGEETAFDAFKLWNYNEGGSHRQRGVKEVDIYYALNDEAASDVNDPAWVFLKTVVFAPATGANLDPGCDIVEFPAIVRASGILFDVKSAYHEDLGSGFVSDSYCGFSKIRFYTKISPFDLAAVTGLSQNTATLGAFCRGENANLLVTAWWALADCGTNTANWAAAPGYGTTAATTDGADNWFANATGLTLSASYIYRFRGVDSVSGEIYWSEPGAFSTKGDLPEIVMLDVVANSVSDVVANVRLDWTGSLDPLHNATSVTLYWGSVDGGDDAGAWLAGNPDCAPVEVNGCVAGNVPVSFAVPLENRIYYCRAFASNTAGTTAASESRYVVVATLGAAQVKALYWGGGSSDILNGTPLPCVNTQLSGTWDLTTKNWSVDTAGTQYVAWENGEDRVAVFSLPIVNTPVNITLGDDVAMNKMHLTRNYKGDNSGENWGDYHFEAASARTLTLCGSDPELLLTGNGDRSGVFIGSKVELVAENGFVKNGSTRVLVYSKSDRVLGAVKTTSGYENWGIQLTDAGSMTGVSEFNNQSYGGLALYSHNNNPVKINTDAVVRLRYAGLHLDGNSPAITNDFRQIVAEGSAFLYLRNNPAGPMFRLTDPAQGFSRGVDGTSTAILFDRDTTMDLPAFASSLAVLNGLPVGVPLPWIVCDAARPVMLNPVTRVFEKMPVEAAPADLTTWTPDGVYRVEGSYFPVNELPSIRLRSLHFDNTNGDPFAFPIQNGGTLTLATGHLGAHMREANTRITGGRIESGTNQLYIMTDGHGQKCLYIESELSGNMDIITTSLGGIQFTGTNANTYTGTLYVNGICNNEYGGWHGRVFLTKENPALAVTGDIVINAGGALQPGSHQIAPNASVTVREGGILVDSGAQIFNGVMTLENGTIRDEGGYGDPEYTHPGFGIVFANGGRMDISRPDGHSTLHIYTDVLYPAAAANQALFTTNMNYNSGIIPHPTGLRRMKLSSTAAPAGATTVRTFEVHDSAALPPETPEMLVDFPLASENDRPVELLKTGAGAMELKQLSGYFRGSARVLDGALWLNGPYATQAVITATSDASLYNGLTNMASNAGLLFSQPVKLPNGAMQWISNLTGEDAVQLTDWVVAGTEDYTFLACGSLGAADIEVEGAGTLGGAGGAGGNVTVNAGGALSPGTPAQPIATFQIGGDLDFSGGGAWRVDLLETADCDFVRVAGDITLGGGNIAPDFHANGKRPKGAWTIAAYGGGAYGKMTAPQGCKVRVDTATKTIQFISSEAGALLIVR